jgi:hypothetical protein
MRMQEWDVAEEKARGRNDSALPCPICREQFRLDDQVQNAAPCIARTIFVLHARC